MKRLFTSKKFLLILLLAVVAAAVAGYFLLRKSESNTPQEEAIQQEVKADDLFAYLESDEKYSTFFEALELTDFTEKLAPKAPGLDPSFIIFAPDNDVYKSDEMKPYAALSAALKAELAQYHVVILHPATAEEKPSLELTDGKVLTTAAGREIIVKKVKNATVLIDVKGRQVKPVGRYVVDPKGNRIYFTDSALLLQ